MKMNAEKKDTLYLFVLQGMNYAIPIILLPYLMINLGVNSYGLIGFSAAIIQILILLVDFGFNMSATKRVAMYKDDKDELSKIFYSTIYAKSFFLIISIFIFLIIMSVEKFSEYRLALLCTLPMLIASSFTFTWFYQGVGHIRFLTVLSMFSRIMILPLMFYFVHTSQDYVKAILINSSVYIVISVLSIFWLYNKKMVNFFKIDISTIKVEIKESFPFFLSTASISIYTQFFVIILGFFSNPVTVGVYTAAEKIIRSISLLFYTPINQVYYPKIANIAVKHKEEALNILKNIFKFTFLIMLILSSLIFIFSDLVENLIGKEYLGIGNVLKILSPVPLIAAIGGVAGQLGLIAYIDSQKTKNIFQNIYIVAGLGAIFQVIIMTYYFELIGTSLAVLFTEIIVSILMVHYFIKYFKIEQNSIK